MSVFACLSAALLAALLPLSVQSADAAHGSPARSVAESAAFPDPPSDFALALEPPPRFLADVRNSISAPARRGDYAWPTGTETRVLRSFDLPEQRWLSGHRGVDLSLDAGATVLAAGTGEVIYAARNASRHSRTRPLRAGRLPALGSQARTRRIPRSPLPPGRPPNPPARIARSKPRYARGWAWAKASRRRSALTCVYRCVVASDEWPRNS